MPGILRLSNQREGEGQKIPPTLINKNLTSTTAWVRPALGLTALLALALPFLPVPEEPTASFFVFLGRFHPLLLHFPIVLVLLLIGLEGWQLYRQRTARLAVDPKAEGIASLTNPLLALTLLSALVTLAGGYLLYRSGEYQGLLVRRHLWGGVLLMVALNGAAWFRWTVDDGASTAYRGLLLLAGGILLYTSHIGGSLTHGQDFLTEHMPTLRSLPPAPVENKKPEELLVFQDLLLPVFEDRCASCHNEYKTKGGLLMTSYAAMLEGGKSGKPMLVDGQPEKSELFHRITLPPGDDERMPPSEKAPLSDDEIALIHWWIQSGAGEEQVLGVEPPDSIIAVLDRYLPRLYRSERLKVRQREAFDALATELATLGDELGLVIEPDPENPGFFGVAMQMPPAYVDNRTVSKLLPYADLYSKLSLPGAEITDDALFDIGRMRNLKGLYLPKTCIKGEGLAYLQPLSQLERLNLSNSFLSNAGALNLTQLPSIETVYVFGAETDTLMLQALRQHLPEVEILEEEGPYY